MVMLLKMSNNAYITEGVAVQSVPNAAMAHDSEESSDCEHTVELSIIQLDSLFVLK